MFPWFWTLLEPSGIHIFIYGVSRKKLFYSNIRIFVHIIVVSKPFNPFSRKEPVGGNWGTHLIKKAPVLTNNGTDFPTFGSHFEFDV